MVVKFSHVIPYVIHVVGVGFPAGSGEGGPALRFSGFLSGGLPEWGYLDNLGLGSGCSSPFKSPVGLSGALFPGSTIVLEGIV